MIFHTTDEAKNFIHESEVISFDDSFSLSSYCSRLLNDSESVNNGREIVIRALDSWGKFDSQTYPIWNDLIESAGLYPYLDGEDITGSALLRYEFHKSRYLSDIYFHEEQQKISMELLARNSVVLSAPTSFGKSLLIEELVASGLYRNIVIIQPTLALLDETRKKLKKYTNQYKLIVSTNQKPSNKKGNLFLFTGERVVEYAYFDEVDFFVIDEFYKLSLGRDDDRAITLNQAFYKLLKHTIKFYLLGPIVKSVPKEFNKNFSFLWYHTNFTTVAVDEINLYKGLKKLKKDEKSKLLFELLDDLEEPTLIYCASPSKATNLTLEYVDYLNNKNLNKQYDFDNDDIIEWINDNIHQNWILKSALKIGIAFHHGAIPRHLGSSIVDQFNSGNIKKLFCTSTLIEGVNTSAKNVILYDKTKGTKSIDYFDYRNISGRSGRMYNYYIGNVYRIEREPVQLELDIDIPIITQEDAPPELLLQLDEIDLNEKSKENIKKYQKIDKKLDGVLKKNAGIPLDGQLKIIQKILSDTHRYNRLLFWTGVPSYDQLYEVLNLGWTYLLKPNENKGSVRTAKQLTFLTHRYYNLKSLKRLILEQFQSDWYCKKFPDEEERINIVVYAILNVSRHWFNYKLPKWLNVLSNLQEIAFKKTNLKHGNYSYFASQIEKGFIPANLFTLFEHEIPISALRKLQKAFDPDEDVDNVLERVSRMNLRKYGLIEYEIRKIRSIL
jgi:hypothetical protein